jgi:hypothetical protein
MFGRKRAKKAVQPQDDAPQAPSYGGGSRPGPNGYVITELPTYHGLKRKVVVYTSDANGKIIKTFKK